MLRSIAIVALVLPYLASSQSPAPAPPNAPTPAPGPAPPTYPTSTYLKLMKQDILVAADIWDEEPKIFTANYAFEGIKGVENGDIEQYARAAGGAWERGVPSNCTVNNAALNTTVVTPSGVSTLWGWPAYNADAMPVVFSWPLLPSSVDPTDFELELNNGTRVNPDVASLNPNLELNERSTVVIFGEFGNRISALSPGSVYVKSVRIVDDLFLVGPNATMFNAKGLEYDAAQSLAYNGSYSVGPKLVGAKLTVMSIDGEDTGGTAPNPVIFPNDCTVLYGVGAMYRLRMFTSGGFSPDGVDSVFPTDYEKYFRVHVETPLNNTLMLEKSNFTYNIPMLGNITILGLADLGHKQDVYDACYLEDHDNQIDICISGDRAVVERITYLEMPVGNSTADPKGQYKGLYNPGGPGNDPTPGVNYTVASSYQYFPVRIALDDPMQVSYGSLPPAPAPGPMNPSPTPSPTPAPGPSPSPSAANSATLVGAAAATAAASLIMIII